MFKPNEINSTPALDLDYMVPATPTNKEPLLDNNSPTLPPSPPHSIYPLPTNSIDDLQVPPPSSTIQKKRKKIINRVKAIPVTRTQKRARWIPGHRYMPFLVLQWFWHPISVLMESLKSSTHVNDQKLHHNHHYHHNHHHQSQNAQVGTSSSRIILGEGTSGDIFMEWLRSLKERNNNLHKMYVL